MLRSNLSPEPDVLADGAQVATKREADSDMQSIQDPNSKRAKLNAQSDTDDRNNRVTISSEPASTTPVQPSAASTDVSEKLVCNGDTRKGIKKEKSKKEPKKWAARRRGTRSDKPEGAEDVADGKAGEKAPRLPKRQCALLIGFCGSGYNGMQIQPDVRTIEGVLFKALIAAGAVSQDNADDPVKVNLARAARTDAGVHAAGNVVSLKVITAVPGVPNLVTRVNEELPPEIRLWSISASNSSTPTQDSVVDEPLHQFWADAGLDGSREQDMLLKKRWRVGAEQVETLRAAAKRFEGTHNFHNYTVGREQTDRSSLLSLSSYIAVRTGTPYSIINELYGKRMVTVPKMPSLGLLLEHPIFESYNKRVTSANEVAKLAPDDPDFRAPLDFDVHAEVIHKFKEEHIYRRMREAEEKIEVYAGPDLLYYNVQGTIPEAAVQRKGMRHANAFKERKRFDATEFVADAHDKVFAEEDDNGNDGEEDEKEISKKELEEAEG
ncbi:hypothetical protein EW145_g374 [Phellinidium pouzarii]|uniref:Pseudouridine synthase I TruA alpha/beta domain-containing protein n=1 Tax=Phellinidium pouzarii TaxID=167371 RepID=A0A4S4LIK2_9AGAM|nr:hypothetical protein EW145_g374 [Phellinidium pouzarii]